MAERSGFFNSTPGDIREYTDKDWANYFSKFLSSGIHVKDNEMGLRVQGSSGMSVSVSSGAAFIRGFIYENTTPLTKVIEPSDPYLNRIDRVVLRLDEMERNVKVVVKKGNPSGSPVEPPLINETMVEEVALAKIIVNSGSTSVQVVDERFPMQSLMSIPYGVVVYSASVEPSTMKTGDIWLRRI